MSTQVLLLDAAIVVASALVVVAVLLVAVAGRRRALTRVPGSFDCAVRLRGRAWSAGVGRFDSFEVVWWNVLSLTPRPRARWSRSDLDVVGHRSPSEQEGLALQPGDVVLRCTHRGACLELGMSSDAATGFTSWLEAAPPGHPGP